MSESGRALGHKTAETRKTGETIVFVGGHWLGHCDREWGSWSCDCDEHYVDIFNCCPECGSELDKFGECPDEEEHAWR